MWQLKQLKTRYKVYTHHENNQSDQGSNTVFTAQLVGPTALLESTGVDNANALLHFTLNFTV